MAEKKIQSNYDSQIDVGRKLFLDYDQEGLIQKFHLQADKNWIYLRYLNTPCRINRDNGQIDEFYDNRWTECRSYNTVMTIYDLLCYHQGPKAPELLHQWCTVGTFIVTGVQNTGTFTKKYAALFDGHLPQLQQACKQLGGCSAAANGRFRHNLPNPGHFLFPSIASVLGRR